MKHRHRLAVSGLLFGATVWGVIWYPYRLLQQMGVSGATSSFYTYALAALAGALLFRHCRPERRLLPAIGALALAAGWTNLSYVLAVIDGEIMRVMLLFYLSPLWTLVLAHFWLRERCGRRGLAIVVISLAGAVTMLWQPGSWPVPANTAEWLALSSGMGFALTNVLTRRSVALSVRVKSMAVWLGVTIIAAIAALLQDAPFLPPAAFGPAQWVLMGVVAVLLAAATLLVQYGVTHVQVTRAAVIFLFELVVAAVASYYLAHEALTLKDWLGGSLIILAALMSAVEMPARETRPA